MMFGKRESPASETSPGTPALMTLWWRILSRTEGYESICSAPVPLVKLSPNATITESECNGLARGLSAKPSASKIKRRRDDHGATPENTVG